MSDSTYSEAVEEIIAKAMGAAVTAHRFEGDVGTPLVAALNEAVAAILALRNQEVISK